MINICFDARVLKNGLILNSSRSGIYFVARNILLELLKRQDKANISVFIDSKDTYLVDKLNDTLGINIKNVLTEKSDFSNTDIFFSPFFKIPDEIKKYPNVSCYLIIYDVIPLLFPDYFTNSNSKNYFRQFCKDLKFDTFYFSISDYTKLDFLKYFSNMDADKITTIPLSSNFDYKPNKDENKLSQVREKYNIPTDKKYLFSLCSLEPRKNLIRSVKTFIEFIKKNNIDDLVYILGGGAWDGFIEKLEKEVPEYKKYTDKIIRAGYIDDEDLAALYSGATFFVYTSQYEGFGMPPLEAMKCGCPVITSNNSSLPEVVGDAGIMIDWDSDEQHIAAYEKYYFDKKYRDSMAKKGLERSKQFSWNKTVDIILNKMEEIEKLKNNQPLVTIITPTFNLIKGGRKETFVQSVTSAHNQTYKNIEHIVIDGASNDGTIDLLKEYQDMGWIKYYSEPDKGIYDAMNKGIKKAKGKYVVCLNSDDFYCDEHAVEMLVKKAEETGADACYADAERVHPKTLKIMDYWSGKRCFHPYRNAFPCHQTFLIKTDVMKELGLYEIKYKVSADNAFFVKMVNHNKKFVGIERAIIKFRDGGFSNDNMNIAKQDQINALFENYGKYHGLTKLDVKNLIWNSFINLPLDEALVLGSKLEKPEWRQSFFEMWINNNTGGNIPLNPGIAQIKKYNLFDVIPLLKIKQKYGVKRYLLCGFFPILKVKYNEDKVKSYLFSVIPLTYKSNQHGVYKFRIFGIPVLKRKG
ncbi:MAG: glycosyltransferase [Alphaproteobacteria bacterium]|nr:glycosyltransferase [Alphaproteobacteria bacterium]MBQ6012318.1 glycosyltransferase [Alphaproteobacteria bacterium]